MRVAVIDDVMGVSRGRRRSCSIQIVVASELPSTKPISAGVDEDAIEPGVESLGIAEPAMLLPGSYERVVGRIFRLLCVAEDEARQPVGIVEARTHEPLECGSAFDLGIGLEGPTGVAQLSLSTREPPLVPTHQMPETFNRERGKPNASREVRESLLLSRSEMTGQAACIAAIWMRLPQVSSKTAVVTGPISVGGWVNRTPRPLSRSNSAWTSSTANDVYGMPSATSASLNGRAAGWRIGLEEELDAVGRLGRDDGQPAGVAGGDIGLLHEAEDIGVEGQRLGLVVDQDARGHDLHRSVSFRASGQRSAISLSGVVSR